MATCIACGNVFDEEINPYCPMCTLRQDIEKALKKLKRRERKLENQGAVKAYFDQYQTSDCRNLTKTTLYKQEGRSTVV